MQVKRHTRVTVAHAPDAYGCAKSGQHFAPLSHGEVVHTWPQACGPVLYALQCVCLCLSTPRMDQSRIALSCHAALLRAQRGQVVGKVRALVVVLDQFSKLALVLHTPGEVGEPRINGGERCLSGRLLCAVRLGSAALQLIGDQPWIAQQGTDGVPNAVVCQVGLDREGDARAFYLQRALALIHAGRPAVFLPPGGPADRQRAATVRTACESAMQQRVVRMAIVAAGKLPVELRAARDLRGDLARYQWGRDGGR